MLQRDICIIGGGAAGVAAAVKLQSLGYRPLLISKAPNNSMIQTLSPGVFIMLKSLGLRLQNQNQICVPVKKTLQQWNGEFFANSNSQTYLVRRDVFDQGLLNCAEGLGIEKLDDARITHIERDADGWKIHLLRDGKYSEIKTLYLVDASGKKSLIRGKKVRGSVQTFGVTGQWKNTGFERCTTRLESMKDGWLWGAVNSDGDFQATVFFDPYEQGMMPGKSWVDIYLSFIKKSSLFHECFYGEFLGHLHSCETTPYYYENPAGFRFIKVGESNIAYDPVSSQGIQMALAGGVQGAIVINTVFKNPNESGAATDFYRNRSRNLFRSHLANVSKAYASAEVWNKNPFWSRRVSTNPAPSRPSRVGFWNSSQMIQLNPDTSVDQVLCIVGDQVVTRVGLRRPGLEEPLVFWDNLEISRFIDSIHLRKTCDEWICDWSSRIDPVSATQLFYKLKDLGILVLCTD